MSSASHRARRRPFDEEAYRLLSAEEELYRLQASDAESAAPGLADHRARRRRLDQHRRALVVDVVLAVVVAVVCLSVAPGLGVIALIAVPLLLLGALSVAGERYVHRRARRRPRAQQAREE